MHRLPGWMSALLSVAVWLAACGRAPLVTTTQDAGTFGGASGETDVKTDSSTDGEESQAPDIAGNPEPPDTCQTIAQVPAGTVPVCTYAGGKPNRTPGCWRFPVRLSLDRGSYYFETREGIVQCPRDKSETALRMSTGTYTGVVQETLTAQILDGGLVRFSCRTDEPNGPGFGHNILCSDSGIQVIPADKGSARLCLEFPETKAPSGAAGYLGWLPAAFTLDPAPGCQDTGVPPQIDYTPLSGFPTFSPSLGSEPIACTVSQGSVVLSFEDLLGQAVTIVLGSLYGVRGVQWQGSASP